MTSSYKVNVCCGLLDVPYVFSTAALVVDVFLHFKLFHERVGNKKNKRMNQLQAMGVEPITFCAFNKFRRNVKHFREPFWFLT
jgi:hypothetical protein